MKIYQFQTRQKLPVNIDEVWDFFNDPKNLMQLMPPWMHFSTIIQLPDEMYVGMIATYQVKPLLGIRLNWVTEITYLKEKEYFIDEQRFGPFRFWHHKHRFQQTVDGVEMFDTLYYALPLGLLGQLIHALIVRKKIKQVFNYRHQKLAELFSRTSPVKS